MHIQNFTVTQTYQSVISIKSNVQKTNSKPTSQDKRANHLYIR